MMNRRDLKSKMAYIEVGIVAVAGVVVLVVYVVSTLLN
jgi:hypothetical protein